ncbi:putative membrane protein [Streptococcus pneumoniae GA47502]|uniref:Uncharacterized protein n=2 Tax=Streptococcus pneumoniae TaxID=1313 RepID=A0A0H2UQ19_STRPN|nr:hypothetical protein SP_1158 [Streptococcus pneumoniae TIGR4]ABJ55258.1 hypothetical protein SPD_1022 [Streptococcus pneumoniae D39]EHD30077.1 putative membrane protein [Streptococcus pneumoniae GA47502]EHD42784.1 putative membrane protein [Streptococcus pneumoniae GA43265]EHD50386.1 putative membrane protein [Streptococcus pneumoniae 6901-05]EHD57761.1 putative membrane protein [Streptococcus pneumoniae GA44500]EHE21850.1 putative membrane protein [Streptococcus pneumoniae GA41437]EHE252
MLEIDLIVLIVLSYFYFISLYNCYCFLFHDFNLTVQI